VHHIFEQSTVRVIALINVCNSENDLEGHLKVTQDQFSKTLAVLMWRLLWKWQFDCTISERRQLDTATEWQTNCC